MRITVVAVGRSRSSAEQTLCDLHWERAAALGPRLGFPKLDFAVVDISRAPGIAARMDDEARKVAARIPSGAYRIALDEAGKSYSSEAFARHLAGLRDRGTRDLAFLIGGPDGLAPALGKASDMRLAFGPQTWPHLMVRAMLAEQIYRAFAILSGHPYHRGRPGE